MFALGSPLARFGPWLVIATIALAAVATAIVSSGSAGDPDRYGGDFPSFYGAGTIIVDGDGSDLYSVETQTSAQSGSFSGGEVLYFAYPPFTAVMYAGLAWLPYGAAYAVHSLLAIAALVGAIVALRPFVRGSFDGATRLGVAAGVAIVSYPVLRSVLGGQNATFTLVGMAAVARFDHDDRPAAAGMAAAALLYKPQYGLAVIGLLALSGRWRAVAWASVASGALFVVGAAVMGLDWIATWLSAVSTFSDLNIVVNGHLMISAWGWIQNLAGVNPGSYLVAALMILAVGLPMVVGLVTRRWSDIPWYALAPFVVIAAPSALYYDATVVLITVAVVAASVVGRAGLIVAAAVAFSWTQVFAWDIGWSPLFPAILGLAAFFAIGAVRGDRRGVTPDQYTR